MRQNRLIKQNNKSVFDKAEIVKNICIAFSVVCPITLIASAALCGVLIDLTVQLSNSFPVDSFWTLGVAIACLAVCAVVFAAPAVGIVLCAIRLKRFGRRNA